MAADKQKLNSMIQKVIEDIGATFHAPLVSIGEKHGLFRAMANAGPLTAQELAKKTGTAERYVQEWLPAMAAGGYVDYDAQKQCFSLSAEQALVLADENSPCYMAGAFQAATRALRSESKIARAFLSGEGVCWSEHDPEFYHGAERFYRPNYVAHLISSWIPALEGVAQKLQSGGQVADVGCGFGTSTIIMAKAFPKSHFLGIDFHKPSVTAAAAAAEKAGVADRVRFAVCRAEDMDIAGYDLITMFDCLHDMGNPLKAAQNVFKGLTPDGTWMLVEPYTGDNMEENFTPVGRLYYCASVLLCTPGALAQESGIALGGQAGAARLRELIQQAGFTQFRRVVETPINAVYEVKH